MNALTEELTAELRDELAANNRRLAVDPRTQHVRFHNLKAMAQSAQHCLASFNDTRPDTIAMKVGSGTHAMLFGLPVVQFHGKVRRGNEWTAFQALNAGAAILNRKEWARAEAICAAVRSHTIASRLLFKPGTIREQTILWDQNGRARRSTPDVRGPDYVVEMKTTRCAEPARFSRDASYRCYHAQLADQCAAIKHATGTAPREAYIVAVESVEPYAITVLQLTTRALEKGEQLCKDWLSRLIAAEASNEWPPYSTRIEPFDVADEYEMSFGDDPADPDWLKADEP